STGIVAPARDLAVGRERTAVTVAERESDDRCHTDWDGILTRFQGAIPDSPVAVGSPAAHASRQLSHARVRGPELQLDDVVAFGALGHLACARRDLALDVAPTEHR